MPETILIIDDEPGIAAALIVRLQSLGYRVQQATNGRDGIEAAEAERPGVILLDIRMPDIDGYETCELLKSNPVHRDVPIIFLSANAHDSARERAMESGGAAFLSKPYEAADLVRVIERVIGAPSAVKKELEHHA